jgi:hypothetical protein
VGSKKRGRAFTPIRMARDRFESIVPSKFNARTVVCDAGLRVSALTLHHRMHHNSGLSSHYHLPPATLRHLPCTGASVCGCNGVDARLSAQTVQLNPRHTPLDAQRYTTAQRSAKR